MSIRIGDHVLAKIKRKGSPTKIVSGLIAKFTGYGQAFIAVDGRSNPQPATHAEREMLATNHAVFRDGRRVCHAAWRGKNIIVEVELVDLDRIKPVSEDDLYLSQEVKKLLDKNDADTLIVADAIMAQGLLLPTGEWTLGETYVIGYCLSRMSPAPMDSDGAWTLADCFEDLRDPEW